MLTPRCVRVCMLNVAGFMQKVDTAPASAFTRTAAAGGVEADSEMLDDGASSTADMVRIRLR